MKKPILVIMAAGLGSRYGGLKQMDPVDESGHLLIDYALFDSKKAGFEKVVFIIKKEIESDFKSVIGDRISNYFDVCYAYQDINNLPEGYSVPEGREKPWGTAHAVLSAKQFINAPFAAINADDFYGEHAFSSIYGFLKNEADDKHHSMIGYLIENTLTEHGHVARGVCKTDDDMNLIEVVERTHIEPREGGAAFTEDGENFTFLPDGTYVSMNMWGFNTNMIEEIEKRFASYLDENLPKNPLKCEYFLPLVPNILLNEKKASVKVIPTMDKWYGVTYRDDMPKVRAALKNMQEQGLYPKDLW